MDRYNFYVIRIVFWKAMISQGDLKVTYFVDNVDEAFQQLVKCTYECLEKAIAIVKPGVRFCEIGEVINRHVTISGSSVVKSYIVGIVLETSSIALQKYPIMLEIKQLV